MAGASGWGEDGQAHSVAAAEAPAGPFAKPEPLIEVPFPDILKGVQAEGLAGENSAGGIVEDIDAKFGVIEFDVSRVRSVGSSAAEDSDAGGVASRFQVGDSELMDAGFAEGKFWQEGSSEGALAGGDGIAFLHWSLAGGGDESGGGNESEGKKLARGHGDETIELTLRLRGWR